MSRYDRVLRHSAFVLPYEWLVRKLKRMFKPQVQVALKLVLLTILVGTSVVAFMWGYRGRQEAQWWSRQAQAWKEIACSSRSAALPRVTPGLGERMSACETHDRVGFGMPTGAP
jgi:hypothetical protein